MGYGNNPEVVASRYYLLEDLDKGLPTTWECDPPSGTRKMAYQIREALKIASLHPDLYPGLATAYQMFSIVIVQPGRIEARFKEQPVVVTKTAEEPAPLIERTPEHGIGPAFKTVPQVGITTAQQCIDSWLGHLPSSDPIKLLDTRLSFEELMKLHAWTEKQRPRMMMLVGSNHITLTLYEAETAAVAAWAPPPVPGEPEEFDI